jgi:hypothetical protein
LCRSPHKRSFVRLIKGKEVQDNIRYGSVPVQLPDMDTPLNMVVVQGISNKPMMLLTTLKIHQGVKDLWFIIQAYGRDGASRRPFDLSNKLMTWRTSGS